MVSDAVFASTGGYPAILTESNDTGFVKRIVGIGLGIALIPIFAVADELRSGLFHAFRFRTRRSWINSAWSRTKVARKEF